MNRERGKQNDQRELCISRERERQRGREIGRKAIEKREGKKGIKERENDVERDE